MPPHCDTLDGPVVKAIKMALEKNNVNYILPWVPEKAEHEVIEAFHKTFAARKQGKPAMEVADYWLYETVVRLHREGEGAPYTGLKPAGLDWGPVVPRAEKAIQNGDPKEVIDFINHTVQEELEKRFHRILAKKNFDANDVAAAREYVQAELGFVLFSHGLYAAITGESEHDEAGINKHEH
jgi:hypothetical protein